MPELRKQSKKPIQVALDICCQLKHFDSLVVVYHRFAGFAPLTYYFPCLVIDSDHLPEINRQPIFS